MSLLEQKGKGRSTYYLPSEKLLMTPPPDEVGTLEPELGKLSLKTEVGTLGGELETLDSLPKELRGEILSG